MALKHPLKTLKIIHLGLILGNKTRLIKAHYWTEVFERR